MGKKFSCVILFLIMVLSIAGCGNGGSKDLEKAKVTPKAEQKETQASGDKISFSETGYFYSTDIEVEIKGGKPGKIYYSLDGSDPDQEQTLYKEPIKLIANNDTKANVIRAKKYYEDGTESDTIVHTYFVGKNVDKRFDTLILSVTTDPYNLFDYEYGIFVTGKLRDDYIKKNPGVKINPDAPANYNMRGKESEREVNLEVFEPDGTQVIDQKVGIRTYGAWSRDRAQKSFKIFARKEYDPENKKLKYAFFPNRTSITGDVIDSFKQIVVRNCGNDNGFAFMRDELFQTLAGQAGYPDYEAVRPAAVFVNGDYRGFFWMHEVYNDNYFEDHYGKYQGNFEILEGGELFKKSDAEGENSDFITDYEDMYNEFSNMDLTDDKNYEKLCAAVDVENYLSYYALNIFLGNEDWPHNNYKTYRYYVKDGEKYGKAPFDGKWRYLPHDMDFSTGIYGTGPDVDNIQNYIGQNGEIKDICPLFGQLMLRPDCKEIFIKKTLDLVNGAFASDNFNQVVDEMNTSRLNELKNTYGKNLLDDWVTDTQLPGMLQGLKGYIYERDKHILTKYRNFFKLGDIYSLSVALADGCQVKINSFTTASSFTGSYYKDYATTITAVLPKGKKFDSWLVNGKKIEGEELTIISDMVSGDKVEVEMIVK